MAILLGIEKIRTMMSKEPETKMWYKDGTNEPLCQEQDKEPWTPTVEQMEKLVKALAELQESLRKVGETLGESRRGVQWCEACRDWLPAEHKCLE